jgi:hypothetical protein
MQNVINGKTKVQSRPFVKIQKVQTVTFVTWQCNCRHPKLLSILCDHNKCHNFKWKIKICDFIT